MLSEERKQQISKMEKLSDLLDYELRDVEQALQETGMIERLDDLLSFHEQLREIAKYNEQLDMQTNYRDYPDGRF